MPYCYVPNCRNGSAAQRKYYENNNIPKVHFFQPPNEEARLEWDKLIKRKDTRLSMPDANRNGGHKVCSAHFKEDFIIRDDVTVINGETIKIPRIRALLKPGAKPIILEGYPNYYQPKLSQRKSPTKRKVQQLPTKSRKNIPQTPNTSETEHVMAPENPTENDRDENLPQNELCVKNISFENEGTLPQLSPPNHPAWNHQKVSSLALPVNWITCNTLYEEKKVLAHINPKNIVIDKSITFERSLAPKILLRGSVAYQGNLKTEITNVDEAQKLLNSVDLLKVCEGTGNRGKPFSVQCHGAAEKKGRRCLACVAERERLRKIDARKEKVEQRLQDKKVEHKKMMQSLKRTKARLLLKIQRYRKKMEEAVRECSKKKKEVLEEAIENLTKNQQEAVKTIFDCSTKKGPSGRRYTIEWVYECMLMRIKSPALYQHIREHDILPLPCNSTIRGYLKNYSGAYGFQPSTFEMLSKKAEELEEAKRRGIIMIDEIKLTPGVYFDIKTLKTGGFKDFGVKDLSQFGQEAVESYETAKEKLPSGDPVVAAAKKEEKKGEKNKNKMDKNLGDHALVITYQPFQGSWVQNLACFLTKDAANDAELTKLILESIILTEYAGFFVDGVVTDGAVWNRSMWAKFGVTEKDPSSEHPCDSNPNRRLYFFSDFPHLLKCMRNCFLSKKVIETPDGSIKLDHWRAVVEADELRQVGLRECPRLTKEHLNPDAWSKMRCNLAWQFWSGSASAGMASYRFQGVKALEDCDKSIQYCNLVNRLSDVMNSRTPKNALRPDSEGMKIIDGFLLELKSMQDHLTAKMHEVCLKAEKARMEHLRKQNKRFKSQETAILKRREWVFSESTDVGLKVSLENTKSLLEFLYSRGYQYLMTARLNQDALERFFGLMRQSCGGNTHPEPRVFAQLFRLLSIYSLVKPMKGSNITGGEMLRTLLTLDDLKNKTNDETKKELDKKLDAIIQAGDEYHYIDDIVDFLHDHNYLDEAVDEFAFIYVAGFTARKAQKFTAACQSCEDALKLADGTKATDEHLLIKLKTRGYLIFPSNQVVDLLRKIEKCVISTAVNNELEENILFMVVENLERAQGIPMVGCDEHQNLLTKSIMKFYLIMRMHFLCKRWNERNEEQKKQQRKYRKKAHLT